MLCREARAFPVGTATW